MAVMPSRAVYLSWPRWMAQNYCARWLFGCWKASATCSPDETLREVPSWLSHQHNPTATSPLPHLTARLGAAPVQDQVRRDILPIPDAKHVGLTTYDAKDPDTTYPPITALRPPKGAPNVLIVLLDDVGFGGSSAFGGPCNTPTAERLAAGGLKLNRFHTTALCSPTRQALLTGRNHHSVGMGGITEIATSAPGNSSVRPKDKAPIAETLMLNGYSTAQFGKCHEVPVWEVSPVGPFNQWPTGSGFEYFYGFVGAEANQYYPGLYEGTSPVEPPKSPEEGYTLTEDLADRAITWVRQQKALVPDKPFFMYWAPGATHAPHHVPTAVVGQVQRQIRRRVGHVARGRSLPDRRNWASCPRTRS